MKNDGRNDIKYDFGDDQALNDRLSHIFNEACHVFYHHSDGYWKKRDKPRYAMLLAKEIAKKQSLIKKLLNLKDHVVRNITYEAIEINKRQLKLEKLKKSLHSYMSNTKWRKLFTILGEFEDICTGSRWKMIYEDDVISESQIPTFKDVRDFHLCDGVFYYVVYDEIEWVECICDKPDVLLEALKSIGEFEIEVIQDGVRIYGYKK